jgi:hypothetical protein
VCAGAFSIVAIAENTAFKGPAVVPASGSRPPVFVIEDQDAWSAMVRWQRNFYP